MPFWMPLVTEKMPQEEKNVSFFFSQNVNEKIDQKCQCGVNSMNGSGRFYWSQSLKLDKAQS